MGSFVFIALSLIPGYLIPVLSSLLFTFAVGRAAPAMLSYQGRIKPGFVVAHTVVWGLASVVSGYVIATLAPEFKALACVGGAMVLIASLSANATLMKKRQSPLQAGGMVAATVLGIAVGLGIFLKTVRSA